MRGPRRWHDPGMRLVVPAPEHLDGYADALRRGWSPETERPEAAAEMLAALEADPAAFLAGQDDPDGAGPPIVLPDGSTVPRLPGLNRWMWDDDGFAGSIGLRWQPGTSALPPTCLGHIGYAVVPWKQRRGYATAALRDLLPLAREVGLPSVDVTTDPQNTASQRVVLANGGRLVGEQPLPPEHGAGVVLLFRIDLA